MKKSTLVDALSVNQKLLDLAEKASGDEKKEIEKARKTFCDLIVYLSGGIIQMGDAMDKQNDTIKQLKDTIEKYQKAIEIALDDYTTTIDCKTECPRINHGECKMNKGLPDCKEIIRYDWENQAGLVYSGKINLD